MKLILESIVTSSQSVWILISKSDKEIYDKLRRVVSKKYNMIHIIE